MPEITPSHDNDTAPSFHDSCSQGLSGKLKLTINGGYKIAETIINDFDCACQGISSQPACTHLARLPAVAGLSRHLFIEQLRQPTAASNINSHPLFCPSSSHKSARYLQQCAKSLHERSAQSRITHSSKTSKGTLSIRRDRDVHITCATTTSHHVTRTALRLHISSRRQASFL